jgi:hypothetical protein
VQHTCIRRYEAIQIPMATRIHEIIALAKKRKNTLQLG